MEMSSPPSASGANKSALNGLLGRISGLTPLSALGGGYSRVRHWLSGTDRQLLAECPAHERTFFHAQALVMLLVAGLSASGLAPKLAQLWGTGPLLATLIWLGAFALVLNLEVMLLNSIQNTASAVRVIAVRLPLAAILVGLQVVPNSASILHDRIALELHDQAISTEINLGEKNKRLMNLEALAANGKTLEEMLQRAERERAAPPADPSVDHAKHEVVSAEAEVKKTSALVSAATDRVRKLQSSVAAATTDEARAKLEQALKKSQEARSKAATAFNAADARLTNARTALDQAVKEQRQRLETAVADSLAAQKLHHEKLATTQDQLAGAAEKSKHLAEKAATQNFATEILALFKLMTKDWTVAATVMGLLGAFVVLDMVPTLMRTSTIKGSLYMQLINHQREMTSIALDGELAATQAQAAADSELRAQQKLMRENQTHGIRSFCAEDNGALDAQLAHVQRQQEVDEVIAVGAVKANSAVIDALGEQMRKIQANIELANGHPETEDALRSQMGVLLARLDAEAKAMRAGGDWSARQGAQPSGA